eukprot:6478602-Amphidinium_carterae.2
MHRPPILQFLPSRKHSFAPLKGLSDCNDTRKTQTRQACLPHVHTTSYERFLQSEGLPIEEQTNAIKRPEMVTLSNEQCMLVDL